MEEPQKKLVLTPEQSAVLDAEKLCNEAVQDVLKNTGCVLRAEMQLAPPLPTQSKVLIVYEPRLKDERPTPESDRAERVCSEQINAICINYNCVGIAVMKVVGVTGIIGVSPMFIHSKRLEKTQGNIITSN